MKSIFKFIFPNYVSEEAKHNILKYKYIGCDNSFIANYILQPFWRKAVNWLPLNMAPNLVTLVGFFFIILGYVLNLYYLPNMIADKGEIIPSWLFVVQAICVWLYQLFDALDGKQARRTNSSSGLGELFDHGCDSLTTYFVVQTFLSSLQMGINNITVFALFAIMFAFYFAQWEQYHTDIMSLGYAGPTESQYSMIIGHLLTAIYGPSFWLTKLSILGYELQLNQWVVAIMVLSGTLAIIANIHGVIKSGNKPLWLCINQVLPVCILFYSILHWSLESPNLLEQIPHPFLTLFGFLFSFITCRLILSRICQSSLENFQVLLAPLIFSYQPLRSFLFPHYLSENIFVILYFLLVVISYFHFVSVVINTLCDVLKIKCFTLVNKIK
ncbi:CDP-alcohol phosphatidyltransferase [Tieghemostelium lacteum]|uniref:CDP-alcohol phosphatidyltransferase n=1 Tax=Tieghemostelium lacteum TaxID=361077 RepID=A0A152A4X6_TIELA|nr:CDP-alcohol phosphatidyltransferase [Tieghemostelium lacteum]|eukprot:KYR01288.1 CDP-alcohol phosphatidyltransferase [Tieghemostelium lacteum]